MNALSASMSGRIAPELFQAIAETDEEGDAMFQAFEARRRSG